MSRGGWTVRRQQRERGALAPIFGILLVSVLGVLVAVAVDTKRVKEAQAVLAEKLEGSCSEAARELPVTRSVVQRGSANYVPGGSTGSAIVDTDQSATNGIQLASFHRLDALRFIVPFPEDVVGGGQLFSPSGMTSIFNPLSSYGVGNCVGGVCGFAGNIGASEANSNYPTRYFYDVETGRVLSNGVVSCEARGLVDTIVSGQKAVNAKASYRIKVAGPTRTNSVGTKIRRGIIIGIAPEVDTSGDDPRFRFTLPALAGLNPLAAGGPQNQAFMYARGVSTHSGLPGIQLHGSPEVQGGSSSHEEALVRCANPFVAVRNMVLHSVVGRLARLWATRDRTQILVIPPRNQDDSANIPVSIVAHGEDLSPALAASRFELPFINYKPSATPNGETDRAGYLCPYSGGCQDSQGAFVPSQRQMLVASQLRDCFFVFNTQNGARLPIDPSVSNARFEFPFMAPQTGTAPYYSYDKWGFTDIAHRRSAEEAVALISTVEECPFRGTAPENSCAKPAIVPDAQQAPQGLRGDIVAFLQYARGAGQRFDAPGYMLTIPSRVPINNPENNEPNSQVILVVSKRLDPSVGLTSERSRIRAEVDALNSQSGRTITVVYVPANAVDASPSAVENIREAFHTQEFGGPNRVFTVMPGEYWGGSSGIPACAGAPAFSTPNEPLCFRAYWESLLANRTASDIGRTVWESITDVEVAL